MKKRLVAGVLAGILAISAVACGDKGKKDAEKDVAPIEYDVKDYVKLGDYKGIEVTVEGQYEYTDEGFDQYMNEQLLDMGLYAEDKSKTKVEEDSIVNVDYVGSKDDVPFDNGSAEDQNIDIKNNGAAGGGGYIPGFSEGLVGHSVGEEVAYDVKFPDDYGNKDLAGQTVVFTFQINYIAKPIEKTSELTDEIVSKYFAPQTPSADESNSEDKDSDSKDSEDKDSEDKDSKDKDSKDKDSDSKGSEDKDSKDKDSDSKDSEDKDSKDKDSKDEASDKKDDKAQSDTEITMTVDEFLENAKAEYKSMLEENLESDKQQAVADAVVKNSTVSKVPKGLLQARIDAAVQVQEEMIRKQTGDKKATLKKYCEQMGTDYEEIMDSLKSDMKKSTKTELVWQAIAEAEGLKIDDKEFNSFVKNLSSMYGYEDEKALYKAFSVPGYDGERYFKLLFLNRQAADFCIENAVFNQVEATNDDEAEEGDGLDPQPSDN